MLVFRIEETKLVWRLPFQANRFGGCKNKSFDFGGTKPPFRANLLFGTIKVVLSEAPFRDQPYIDKTYILFMVPARDV